MSGKDGVTERADVRGGMGGTVGRRERGGLHRGGGEEWQRG